MKRQITRLMATMALCDSNFPRSWELPQVAPVPANNLGHYVLLNYRELGAILSAAVADINAAVDVRRKSAAVPRSVCGGDRCRCFWGCSLPS